MFLLRRGTRVEVRTPAKINLFLEVIGRREDGFHEIETLISQVGIYDSLFLSPTDDGVVDLECRWGLGAGDAGRLPPPDENIVCRALRLLRERSGVSAGAKVRLVKRIPSEAGLGGASSDAAAALLAASVAWKLDRSVAQLAELGAELGSDVPFFFAGGAALCRGRGERIEPAEGLPRGHCVIAKPPAGLSTPAVYAGCRPAAVPRSGSDAAEALRSRPLSAAGEALFNRLEEPARRLLPAIDRLLTTMRRGGCVAARMSGSGSSCYGIARSRRHARRIASRLRSRNVGDVFAAPMLAARRSH